MCYNRLNKALRERRRARVLRMPNQKMAQTKKKTDKLNELENRILSGELIGEEAKLLVLLEIAKSLDEIKSGLKSLDGTFVVINN